MRARQGEKPFAARRRARATRSGNVQISPQRTPRGRGEKNVLSALTAVGWSKGAGPSLTLANMHKVHIHTIRDKLHLCIQAAVIVYERLQRCIHTQNYQFFCVHNKQVCIYNFLHCIVIEMFWQCSQCGKRRRCLRCMCEHCHLDFKAVSVPATERGIGEIEKRKEEKNYCIYQEFSS